MGLQIFRNGSDGGPGEPAGGDGLSGSNRVTASATPQPGSRAVASGDDAATLRRPWIDRLRITVITGVIMMHASTTYVVAVGASYVERTTNPVTIAVVTVPMVAALLFGLGPLFLVAGWLSASSVRKHGATSYLRSRIVRLGVPIAVYLLVLGPAADYLGARAMGTAHSWAQFFLEPVAARDLGPVWFLAALLCFSLGYGGFRRLRPAHPPALRPLRMSLLIGWMLAIAAADFLVWLRWSHTEVSVWNANFAHWPQAAGLFLLGSFVGERRWLVPVSRSISRTCLRLMGGGSLALAAVAAVAILGGGDYHSMAGGWHWQSGAFALLDGMLGVALAVWAVGAYHRRWNAPLSHFTAGLGRWSYAAYLLHPLMLTVVVVCVRFSPWPPEVKLFLAVVLGVPLSYLTARLVTHLRFVSRII